MSDYRRIYQNQSIIFLTIVTYERQKIFDNPQNISLLRQITAKVKLEIDILGAVILPDHLHFLWQLPVNQYNYLKKVGRLKALFTKSFAVHRPRLTCE